MISFRKPDVVLNNLETNRSVLEKKREVENWLSDGRGANAPNLTDFWNRDDVRGALIAQQGLICAWCQAPLDTISPTNTVDHYRPKDFREPKDNQPGDPHRGYPWLAYQWSNLLQACDKCNTRKGTAFPLRDEAERVDEHCRDQWAREQPLILNPSTHALDDLFELEELKDFPFHRIRVKESHSLCEEGNMTITILKLNGLGRPELIESRNRAIMDQKLALENKDDQVYIESAGRYNPFSWFTRELLSDSDPNQVPDDVHSLLFFLGVLDDKLAVVERHRSYFVRTQGKTAGKAYARQLARLRWAFAVLHFDYPEVGLISEYISEFLSQSSQEAISRYLNILKKNGSDKSSRGNTGIGAESPVP